MLGRKEIPKRNVLSDPKFDNVELTRFMNALMIDGRKPVIERIVYGALRQVEKKTGKIVTEVFNEAITNAKPIVGVKDRRVGDADCQVSAEIHPSRRLALAMCWVRDATHERGEKSMDLHLTGELIDAVEGRGGALREREEVHRMARADKALSHLRF